MEEQLVGEEVRVSVQKKEACKVEMQVVATRNLVTEARKEAVKAVNKEITIPGFRKGKAPEEMIAKKFPGDVEKAFHKEMANLAFQAARKLPGVPPLLNNNAQVSFDMKKLTDEGAEMIFNFETEPHVPSVDPKKFVLTPVKRLEVGEVQIDEAIRQMRFFYAEWKQITDRTVQEGDFIVIDLDTMDGPAPQRVFSHVRFEVKPERMADWMRTLVLNAKSGDILEGVSEPDEKATEEQKKNLQPKKVRLHLIKVEEATLPAVDDEFAKKVGANDVASMREMVSKILIDKADQKERADLHGQVNQFFTDNYSFELPQSIIEAEKRHRISQLMQDQRFRQQWERSDKAGQDKIENQMATEAAAAVRLFYLSRQLIQDQKISISHKEVQDEAIATLRAYGVKDVEVEKISKEVYAMALSKVILIKAQDFILQTAKPSEGKEQKA